MCSSTREHVKEKSEASSLQSGHEITGSGQTNPRLHRDSQHELTAEKALVGLMVPIWYQKESFFSSTLGAEPVPESLPAQAVPLHYKVS